MSVRHVLMHILLAATFSTTSGIAVASANAEEPPIIKEVDSAGHPFLSQNFQATTAAIAIPDMSIAQRYYFARNLRDPINSFTSPVECEIEDDGRVLPYACTFTALATEGQQIALKYLRSLGWQTSFPGYGPATLPKKAARPYEIGIYTKFDRKSAGGARTKRNLPFYRLVHMNVQFGQIEPPPPIDLTSGPLVELSQLPKLKPYQSGLNEFPKAALRDDVSGRMVIECQVQSDLSVICDQISFDPPQNAGYFVDTARAAFLKARVDKVLLNGTNAVGVRTQFNVVLRIGSK